MGGISDLLGGFGGFKLKFDWSALLEALNVSPILKFLVELIMSLS